MTMLDVRPARERFHTELSWLDSWHSFSFASHYDPRNTHHGVLVVNNDDRVAPGGGFPDHPHRDMEIVTWVLAGALHHRDSTGTDGVITPGLAQRMRAGRGIVHSEFNASRTEPVHLVQMWVFPGAAGLEPGYEQADVSEQLDAGGLVAVAAGPGGAPAAATSLSTPGTTLWVARLHGGAAVEVPAAPFLHVFVPIGSLTVTTGDVALGPGDALRVTDADAPLALTAGEHGAEVLVWEMHARSDGRLAVAV